MTPHLAAIRGAQREAIDLAAAKAEARFTREGMPHDLWEVGCWLVSQGLPDDLPCAGEAWFNLPIADVRLYYNALSPAAQRQEIEAGERAIKRRGLWIDFTDDEYLEAAE